MVWTVFIQVLTPIIKIIKNVTRCRANRKAKVVQGRDYSIKQLAAKIIGAASLHK